MKHFSFGYFVQEGVRSIGTHGLMSFAAVCMIVACLFIMGSFSLVAVNAGHMLGDLQEENAFLAYVDESYDQTQCDALEAQIETVPNVASVTFISKEEAKENYLQGREDVELFTDLPDEVFRDRFSIHVTDIEAFEDTVEQVRALTGVVNITAAVEIAEGFVIVSQVASAIAIILIGILVLVSLFIIANTIKLATFTRREEIAIMKMCGATNSFIRWPFVVEGLILGILGATIAFFLQWGVYSLISTAIVEYNAASLIVVLPFGSMALRVYGGFLLAGVLIGAGGSSIAIRKFLQV